MWRGTHNHRVKSGISVIAGQVGEPSSAADHEGTSGMCPGLTSQRRQTLAQVTNQRATSRAASLFPPPPPPFLPLPCGKIKIKKKKEEKKKLSWHTHLKLGGHSLPSPNWCPTLHGHRDACPKSWAFLLNLSLRQLTLPVCAPHRAPGGEKLPGHQHTRVIHWKAKSFFLDADQNKFASAVRLGSVCCFAQLSQSLHANFPPPLFLGRHSQSHSFRWTNMTRHWRENSQLKINTSSNILFTFPVSLFIPKYPVGAGARWLTLMLLKFSHAYLVAAYGNLTLCGFLGGILAWATCFSCLQRASCLAFRQS